jgi:quercetin dioxygenase-like cupin family protein
MNKRNKSMDAVNVKADDIEWQPAAGYPSGAEEKVLSAGGPSAPRTILLKMPPGWSMGIHSHRFTESHYVLQGEYESQGEVCPAGTYRVIPKEIKHGPFSTEKGATVLITWYDHSE